MSVSESQKNAVKKHQAEKLDEIKIRPPKGTKEKWQAAAAVRGVSLQRYIIDAVNSKAGE